MAELKRGINLKDAVLAGGDGPAPETWEQPTPASAPQAPSDGPTLARSIPRSLARRVIDAWATYSNEASEETAILAVAAWLESFPDESGSCEYAASILRREVGQ